MTNIKSPQPKYKKIGEKLIKSILSHRYELGVVLPTEKNLCLEYNVSRHTIREALRYAEHAGLIEKRQGSGSTVISNTMPETINQVVSNVNDILQHGNDTIFKVIHTENTQLNANLARLLNAQKKQKCLRISGLRLTPHDKKPICFTRIYRLPNQENEQPNNFTIKTVMEILDTKNIGKVEQTISACLMPSDIADILKTVHHSAALKIYRRYFANNQKDIILVAESIYAENRFSYSSVLYPD